MINSIAVLLTCHNRKEKTIACITQLNESKSVCSIAFEMDVYLTDDGSTDGTSDELKKLFPAVNILYGNGSLFWAGGMRNSWKAALQKREYDAFFLLNDDTIIERTCFDELFKTHEYSIKVYGKGGIYIGSVKDQFTQEHSYGGNILINKWKFSAKKVLPDGNIKECDLGCSNIMLVHYKVVDTIGIFSEKYIHAKADFDYTLRAQEKKFPILVCPNYCGYCTNDTPNVNLKKMNLRQRIQYLKDPKGVELSGYMYFIRRFFPFRAPFVYCSLWLKTLIPSSAALIDKLMNR
ncbi:MAG: glycosyltransferase family 2 protein [Bacteroidales bacterium]|nr:glycosyltransferase family 2 protein [Bacteroidales bacterium]